MGSPDRSARLRVLCFDEDPADIDLLEHAAEDQPDFEIAAATTEWDEFHALVKEHCPDVVILAYILSANSQPSTRRGRPRPLAPLNGLQLVERTRELAPNAIIVLFTTKAGLEQAARNVGADLYVEKPHVEALWPAIREARSQR